MIVMFSHRDNGVEAQHYYLKLVNPNIISEIYIPILTGNISYYLVMAIIYCFLFRTQTDMRIL